MSDPVPTWTFRRDDDRFVIERRSDRALTVSYGTERRDYSFENLMDLLRFQLGLEDQLLDDGWSLSEFVPERRTQIDRRETPRPTPDRRRPLRPPD